MPAAVRAEATTTPLRTRRRPRLLGLAARRGVAAAAAIAVLSVAVLWLAFAGLGGAPGRGSGDRRRRCLRDDSGAGAGRAERRAAAVAATPVVFTAGDRTWRLTRQLGVAVDWAAAVEAARREGAGFDRSAAPAGSRPGYSGDTPPARLRRRTAVLTYSGWPRRLRSSRGRRHRARGLRPVVVLTGPVTHSTSLPPRRRSSAPSRASAGPRSGLPVRVEQPNVTTVELRPAVASNQDGGLAPVRLAPARRAGGCRAAADRAALALPANGADAHDRRYRRRGIRPPSQPASTGSRPMPAYRERRRHP